MLRKTKNPVSVEELPFSASLSSLDVIGLLPLRSRRAAFLKTGTGGLRQLQTESEQDVALF